MPRIENIPATANQDLGVNQPNPVPPNSPRQNPQEPLFDDDVFLPPSQTERPSLVSGPAPAMAVSDARVLAEIRSASEFQGWLCDQVLRWKPYLLDPTDGAARKFEFFHNARESLTETSMDPHERGKALEAFKHAENLLDR